MRRSAYTCSALLMGVALMGSGCSDSGGGSPTGAPAGGGVAAPSTMDVGGAGVLPGGSGASGAANDTAGGVDEPAGASGDTNPTPNLDIEINGGALPFDCPPDQWGEQRVDVGEVQLNVACRGQGTPVVMLHGYPELHLAWNRLADALVPQGYAIVAPDQRGYNLSDTPPNVDDYHIDRLVADIEGLMDASGQASVLLVAHDWGAPVAFTYTNRNPDRVRGLVILNGPHPDIWGRGDIDPVQKMASDAYVPSIASGLITPALAGAGITGLLPDELLEYQAAWNQPGTPLGMNNWYSANLYPEVKLVTGITIAVPTLVLWATDDAYVTASELDYFPDYISDLRIERFAGDHWLTHRETDRLSALIRDFEAGLP